MASCTLLLATQLALQIVEWMKIPISKSTSSRRAILAAGESHTYCANKTRKKERKKPMSSQPDNLHDKKSNKTKTK
jgi:hypothetical protein